MLDDRSIPVVSNAVADDDRPPAKQTSPSLASIVLRSLPPGWMSGPLSDPVRFLHHADGTRLEVRASEPKRSWATQKPCGARWDVRAERMADAPAGPAIYVFGHHPVWNTNESHRDEAQWRFYVIPEGLLPSEGSLSLPAATALTQAVTASGLAAAVARLGRAGP